MNCNMLSLHQVGDIVRRGPEWSSGTDDGDPPGTGIVIATFAGPAKGILKHNVVVCWEETEKHALHAYHPAIPLREVEVVTAADSASIEKAISLLRDVSSGSGGKIQAPSTPAKESFQIGDFVILSKEPSDPTDAPLIKKVLGNFQDRHVGVIIAKKVKKDPDAVAPQPQTGLGFGSPFASPPPVIPPQETCDICTVAALRNSQVCSVISTCLQFADGSNIDPAPKVLSVSGGRISDVQQKKPQTGPKCLQSHALVLATGIPFGRAGGIFGSFGTTSCVRCHDCDQFGLERDSCYLSCPMTSSCDYHLCMGCAGLKGTPSSSPSKSASKLTTKKKGRRDPAGPFVVGDRVKLARDMLFAGPSTPLGRHADGLVGTVVHLNNLPNVAIICNDPRSPMRNMVWLVPASDIELADTQNISECTPLVVGDRVELCSSYTTANSEYWCLQPTGDGTQKARVGVVLFAPPLMTTSDVTGDECDNTDLEQRLVIVKPEGAEADESDAGVFYYRSSWLDRKVSSSHFKAGDRVQLQMGLPASVYDNMTKKCLGGPTDYAYGIVRSVGRLCGGTQRNIEVVAINSTTAEPQISLYPSYALAQACKETVLADTHELDTLTGMVRRVVDLSSLPIDAAKLVQTLKLQVIELIREMGDSFILMGCVDD